MLMKLRGIIEWNAGYFQENQRAAGSSLRCAFFYLLINFVDCIRDQPLIKKFVHLCKETGFFTGYRVKAPDCGEERRTLCRMK